MKIDNVASFVLVQVVADVVDDFIAQRLAHDVDSVWELVLAGSGTKLPAIGEGVAETLSEGIVRVDIVGERVPVGRKIPVARRICDVLF